MGRINIKMAVTNKPHDNLPEFRPHYVYPEKRNPCQLLFKKPDKNQHKNVNFYLLNSNTNTQGGLSKNPFFVPLAGDSNSKFNKVLSFLPAFFLLLLLIMLLLAVLFRARARARLRARWRTDSNLELLCRGCCIFPATCVM
jgi:hypothetical protein